MQRTLKIMNALGPARFALACITCALALFGTCACANGHRMQPRVSDTTLTAAEAPRPGAGPNVPPPIGANEIPTPTMMPVREWEARYPLPASELTKWARSHPDAAAALAAWEARDSEKPRVMIQWVVGHPYEDLGIFLINRPGWDDFSDLRARYPEAIDSLIEWARHSSRAAEELVTRSTGFASLRERANLNAL
jgi:hypothetical protein